MIPSALLASATRPAHDLPAETQWFLRVEGVEAARLNVPRATGRLPRLLARLGLARAPRVVKPGPLVR